jgi:beta-glucosidase
MVCILEVPVPGSAAPCGRWPRPAPCTPYDLGVIRTRDLATRAPLRLLAVLAVGALVAVGLPAAAGAATPPAAGPTPGAATGLPTPSIPTSTCPWLAAAMAAGDSPAVLAGQVTGRMTLPEKLGEIVLNTSGDYENVNAGVARLCIPSLTLSDGPWGLAFGDTGVSQLPVPLAIGATFDTSLAEQYGEVLGVEARGQGIDVSQGPNLNIDRVPTSGRADESYGEDPLLTTQLGLADIRGMQAHGVMADAKHLAAYSQETNRGALDAVVPNRALQELYLPPFKAAVTQGHVATLMCAYPRLDGNFQCQDPALGLVLQQWGFAGFVRSDLGAVHDQPLALGSGVQQLKPSSVEWLTDLIAAHRLSVATVDADVQRVLTEMFAYGVVGRPTTGGPGTPVDSASHAEFALTAAERSAVLLKDQSGLLPVNAANVGSVAVIGADASTRPVTQGFGSSHVVPPFTSTPLDALRSRLGRGTTVRYAEGGSTTKHLPSVPTRFLTPASGKGHGLTLSVGPASGPGQVITTVDPLAAAAIEPAPSAGATDHDQVRTNPPAEHARRIPTDEAEGGRLPDLDPTTAGATSIEVPSSWKGSTVSWTGTLTPPRSGRYVFSLAGTGAAALTLDGHPAATDLVTHDTGTWSGSIVLAARHHYRLSLRWTPVVDATSLDIPSIFDLGMAYVGDAIDQAVAAAKASNVAVVFAADYSAETFDRPNLSLPGDQDALIAAVAAANPHTVVVLNTGGPVVMPWLSKVGAVVEAWYPGEQDGAAIAAVLAGDVNPSGHLPVTFPTSMAKSAVPTKAQWPGVGLTSNYSEGLRVGYRFNHATGTRPLFPFGFGLSYTSFSYRRATVVHQGGGYVVSVVVTNTGRRVGTDVAQVYVTQPKVAGEPPGQLAAFASVTLAPGVSRVVSLTVPDEQLETFRADRWTTVPGTYRFAVGDSSASQPSGASVSVGK